MTISNTFLRVATVTASTKRPPAITSGKAGVPVTNLASLKCTRLVLADDAKELRETYQLGTLTNILQCFTQGDLDILTGDVLVIGSAEYPIRLVQAWPFGDDVRKRLILEGLKR
jgi:hypothetical protein